jgi:hypothetical protein
MPDSKPFCLSFPKEDADRSEKKKERRKYPPLYYGMMGALVICLLFLLLWKAVGSSCYPDVVLYEFDTIMSRQKMPFCNLCLSGVM